MVAGTCDGAVGTLGPDPSGVGGVNHGQQYERESVQHRVGQRLKMVWRSRECAPWRERVGIEPTQPDVVRSQSF